MLLRLLRLRLHDFDLLNDLMQLPLKKHADEAVDARVRALHANLLQELGEDVAIKARLVGFKLLKIFAVRHKGRIKLLRDGSRLRSVHCVAG